MIDDGLDGFQPFYFFFDGTHTASQQTHTSHTRGVM